MNNLAGTYIEKLLEKYNDTEQKDIKFISPATDQSISKLMEIYPNVPLELLDILKKFDGTCGTYNKQYLNLDFFPPDDEVGISYHLCSIEDVLEHAKSEGSWLALYWDTGSKISQEEFLDDEDDLFGDGINPNALCKDWLLFAENCYSRLFIDFSPSKDGTIGQVVAYVHDPDMYGVMEDSFSAYLKNIIDTDFEYLKYEQEEREEYPECIYAIEAKINNLNEFIDSFNSIPIDVSSLTVSTRRHIFPKERLKKIFFGIPRSITSLKLELGIEDFVELSGAIITLPADIKSLDLSGNSMGRVDASLLAKLFSNIPPHVSSLYLHENNLNSLEGDELALAFESLPQTIIFLELGYNHLGRFICSKLKKIFQSIPKSVTSLNLRGNSFDQRPGNELVYVFSIIPENVRILNLRANSLHSRRETGLDEALNSIPATITQIDLKYNCLKADDYAASPNRIFLF